MNPIFPAWDAHAHVFAGALRAGSHYAPADHTLTMWREVAAPNGFDRVVLVQPSVYGADNSVMLNVLRDSGGVHRGIAVVNADVTQTALEEMHMAGVRGVRFNLVSPMGNDAADIDAVIARIRPLGWHVQFFLRPAQYRWVRDRQLDWGVPIVLDHLAGMRFDPRGQADIETLFVLGDQGAWIKASGYYRLGMQAPFDDVDAMIERLHKRFAGRMVWGSDWPHTWYMEESRGGAPPFEALLAPLLRVFLDESLRRSILNEAPARLYQ